MNIMTHGSDVKAPLVVREPGRHGRRGATASTTQGRRRRLAYRLMALGPFIGLGSYLLFYFLYTFGRKTVGIDTTDTFSMVDALAFYDMLALGVVMVVFLQECELITFQEVAENRWYTPVKMGFTPTSLIMGKIGRCLGIVLVGYLAGFVVVLLLAALSGVPWGGVEMVIMLPDGALMLVTFVVLAMTVSLYMRRITAARWAIVVSALVIWAVRVTSGYSGALQGLGSGADWTTMIAALSSTGFVWYELAAICAGLVVCLFQARTVAMTTNFTFYQRDMDFDKDLTVVYSADGCTFETVQDEYLDIPDVATAHRVVKVVLAVVVGFFLAADIVAVSTRLVDMPGRTTAFGTVPLVMRDTSMEPTVGEGDLAVFKATEGSEVGAGDVVVYVGSDGTRAVKKVVSVGDGTLELNAQNSADGSAASSAETVEKSQVYGRLVFSNAALGAVISAATTGIGTCLFIIVPCLLLLFSARIIRFLTPRLPGA